jgi:hypothetical protein
MTTLSIDISPGRRDALPPRLARTARELGYVLLGLPVGIATFTLGVTGLSLGVGLAVTLVGIPVILLTLLATRWVARLERHRARLVIDTPVPADRPLQGGLLERARTLATDPSGWRGAAWSVLLLPLGVAGFTASVTLWSSALGLLTSPLYYWALPDDGSGLALFDDPAAGYAALRMLIGLGLLPVAAILTRALAQGTARLARAVLG